MSFDAEDMDILIKATGDENFFIIFHWLGSEKLFWLLQRTFIHSMNFICLNVEIEAIGYPSIVSTEDKNLGIIESKRTEGVSWRPHVVLVHVLKLLPLLLTEV